jgi:selenocysteine-specific elongation factor
VNPYTPPSVKEAIEMTGGDLLEALIEQGHLVQINVEVVLSSSTYFSWTDYAKSELSAGRSLKVATFRDQFQTTRKYALGFLEYLEAHQLTRRVGDEHVAGRGDWSRLATP